MEGIDPSDSPTDRGRLCDGPDPVVLDLQDKPSPMALPKIEDHDGPELIYDRGGQGATVRREPIMKYEASSDRSPDKPRHGTEVDRDTGLPLEHLHDGPGIGPSRGDGTVTSGYVRPGVDRILHLPEPHRDPAPEAPGERQALEGTDIDRTQTSPESLGELGSVLDLADIPAESLENLIVKVLVETLADLADATTFPTGQILRLAHKVSQPRITVPITTHRKDSVELHLRTAVTLDGPLLDLEVKRLGDQSTPTTPPDHQPRPKDQWQLDYFWIESDLPCAVAVLPRATLSDLAGLPRLSAEAFAAQVERTDAIPAPYTLSLVFPDASLAVFGLRPARGKRARFTELVQLERRKQAVNRWTVIG